ncbi:MAG: hypothetical protein Q9162_006096 [Coniocarpon cinnabarinum]
MTVEFNKDLDDQLWDDDSKKEICTVHFKDTAEVDGQPVEVDHEVVITTKKSDDLKVIDHGTEPPGCELLFSRPLRNRNIRMALPKDMPFPQG